MILEWDHQCIGKALAVLRKLFRREELQERLPRLKEIHGHAELCWRTYIEQLADGCVKYLLIAEAPPWSEPGEKIQYVLDPSSRSRTLMSALQKAFPTAYGLPAGKALAEFAQQGFLIVDSIPFSMKYTSRNRTSDNYQELVDVTANAVQAALRSSSLNWSRDLRIAFSVKLNARAVIRALGGRLDLNGTVFNLSENLIAVSASGYPDAEKLRALYGGKAGTTNGPVLQ